MSLAKSSFPAPLGPCIRTPASRLCALFDREHLRFQKQWVFADKPVDSLEPLDFLAEAGDFISQSGVFERVFDGQFKFIEVDRFDQVVEGASFYCHDDVFDLFVCGYHDNGRGRAQFLEAGKQFQTASVRESDIEQDQVGLFALGKRESGLLRYRLPR